MPVDNEAFEKLIAGQTEEGIQPKLSDSLTAYRKGQSTETTLVNLVEKWKEAIDNNKIVGVLSTDMSKAFDSLYPPFLLRKLEKYGFSKEAIDMMKSYFENRRNRVKLGDTKSIWKKPERGCPQGSSLGPLLWSIYQNDLSYTVTNCSLTMYADDHQLYVAKDSPKDVKKVINENMGKVCSWYKDNFLHASKEKYQAMTVTGQRIQELPIEFKINDEVMQQTKALKLLGITIDDKLTFNEHVSNTCKKASQRVGGFDETTKPNTNGY